MIADYYRGHEIFKAIEGYIYKDNRQLVSENKDRACGHCGKKNTPEGHDGCLGTLPGVMNACCGHGTEEGYIQFENGVTIRGYFKIDEEGANDK